MRRFFRDIAGAAAVEFAICAPFLITLTIGVSELGRALWCHHTIVAMTRDATRYLSRVPDPTSTTFRQIATNLALHGTPDGTGPLVMPASYGSVTLSYSVVAVPPPSGSGISAWSATQPASPQSVTATAQLTFTSSLIAWFASATSLPMSVSHAERVQTD